MTQSSGDNSLIGDSGFVTVETDDIVQGCVKWLESFSDITDLLGKFEDEQPFIFQWTMQGVLEGSSSSAVVVSQAGSWAAPNVHNTLRVPRLVIEIFADPVRTLERDYVNVSEVRRRVTAIFSSVDKHLHRPQGGSQMWGTLRTLECVRLGDLNIEDVPNGDKMVRAWVYYGVVQG